MIRLLVLDVDGTMTDGGVYYDSAGNELKKVCHQRWGRDCAGPRGRDAGYDLHRARM